MEARGALTLSATAIINGLTMLRAYNVGIVVTGDPHPVESPVVLAVSGVNPAMMHADDYNRMLNEGWGWDEYNESWQLCD